MKFADLIRIENQENPSTETLSEQSSLDHCLIRDLQNDSRRIQEGDAFIAYPGQAADGRLYIDKAIAAGASAVVYDPVGLESQPSTSTGIPLVPVAHLAQRLGILANRFYDNPGEALDITGTTGTNGKTSIAYQLAQAHQLLGNSSAYIGTIGQGPVGQLQALENTTPDALCLVKLLHTYKEQGIKQVCMEVSSHALSQHRVDVLHFRQAIFTNLTLDHLDYHQTMDAYCAAKASLFARKELEWAIINQDDPYKDKIQAAVPPTVKILGYGIDRDTQVRAVNWHIGMQGTVIDLESPWGKQQITTQSLGKFNVYNSLAIISSLLAFGYPIEAVARVMEQVKAAPGRMELVASRPYVLVDYAHTPDALENVLMTLSELKQGRLWVVFGCGGDRDKSKRPLMGRAASLYADEVIITSDNPRSETPEVIIEEIAAGIPASKSITKIVKREEAILKALDEAAPQDVILIAGKGHEAYQQIGQVKQAFSDQEVVRTWYAAKS